MSTTEALTAQLPPSPWGWLRRPVVRHGMLAFAAVHVLCLIWLWPTIARGDALGDLQLYREWAENAFRGEGIMGLRADWVYPLLAWLPIGTANLFGPDAYQAVWFGFVTVLNLLSTLVVLGSERDAPRPTAAYVWLAGILILAPVSMLRIEGFVAPLVVVALMWISRFPFVAGLILAVATWVKVWPAAVIAAVIAARQGAGRILPAGILVTAGVTVIASLAGGLQHIMSFLSKQAERGLQIESPLATLPMWLDALGFSGYYTRFNQVLRTSEMGGPVPEFLAAASTTALVIGALAVAVIIVVQGQRGVEGTQLMLTGALALASLLFVFNKVGSPQFMLWLLPIVVVGLTTSDAWWGRVACLTLVASALTTLLFPLMYTGLENGDALPIAVLTARNALLAVILIVAVLRLIRFAPGVHAADAAAAEGDPFSDDSRNLSTTP